MNLLEYFENELSWIKNEKLLKLCKVVLENAPEGFKQNPSSSSGKYHPDWSHGNGGLLRHTQAATYLAKELAHAYLFSDLETDAVIVATILHDVCKYGLPEQKHTTKDHDVTSALFMRRLADRHELRDTPLFNEVFLSIAFHFGRWTFRESADKIRKFPEEYSKLMEVVHIADYISSRKEIRFNFLEQSLIG